MYRCVCVYRLEEHACILVCVCTGVGACVYVYSSGVVCVQVCMCLYVYSCGRSVHMGVYACTGMCVDRYLCMCIHAQAHAVCDHKTIAGVEAAVLFLQPRVSF